MNHQNNTKDNQNRQINFKQNTQNQYNGQSQYNQSQYGQRNPHVQNVPQSQYEQQQTRNQNQYNQVGLQHLRQPGDLQNQTNQQSKMIKNPEKNITHSPEMNDRDYLNDILATEKYLTDGFNTFTREASHTELHNDVKTILNDTHDCTRDLFNLMFKDGFYSFQGASDQEVQQTQQKFSKYLSQQDPYGTNNTGF